MLANRSAAYLSSEDYDKAFADAQAAIEANKDYMKGYYRKALALQQLDRISEAIQVLEMIPTEMREDESISQLLLILQEEYKADNVLSKDHPEIVSFNKLVEWLLKGGAKFDKIKMRYYSEGYRGVHARDRIKKGEQFLYIPKDLIITLEMAKKEPVGLKMAKIESSLLSPKHSYLSTYVLQEIKKEDTKWRPYFDILPKDTSSFPIFFTADEKKWLEGSPFLAQVEDKINDMKKDYDLIVTAAPDFTIYTLEEFKQIRMLISSRIFGININGKRTDGLVPLADMLNHKRPQETAWEYRDDLNGFVIESKVNIQRGDQVYDSYGRKCNSRYFLNYGFVVENNEADEVPMEIKMDETDPLYSVKYKLLGNCSEKTIRVAEDLNEKNMTHFFSFLRFIHVKGDAMTLYKLKFEENNSKKKDEDNEDDSFQCSDIPFISIENEKAVLNHIKNQCAIQLKKYPTTYEEDIKILDTQKDLSYNLRNCVIMRSGEKHVMIYYILDIVVS